MEKTVFSLDRLQEGQSAEVASLRLGGSIRRRLQDLGLTEGTKVTCCRIGPRGSPLACYFRSTLIALRREDAAGVLLRSFE